MFRLSARRPADDGPVDDVTREFLDLVSDLSKRQAQAVVLFYVDDLPVQTIAEVMGCAEGTVKAHLSQGRKRIEQAWAERANVS